METPMKRLVIALALGLSAAAASPQSLELVEGAAELSLSDIGFPTTAGGTVSFTTCETCDTKRMQVDSGTVYVGLAGAVPLAEFLDDVAELRTTEAGRQSFVGLFYDLRNNRITRIKLYPDAT
jgi:hypothetical protein